jgi:hypothetical protein
MDWTEHTASDGVKRFYYNSKTGCSTWVKPPGFGALAKKAKMPMSLQGCLDESPIVASLFNTILRDCGAASLPTVHLRTSPDDPLCRSGRGGGFCCDTNRIFICSHRWVSCREVAYELSHALNTCRGAVRCSRGGMRVDGADCGFFSPPDVACSELRASHWTGRCEQHGDEQKHGHPRVHSASRQRCLEWHARWAVSSCYPKDEHLEAHVRWARHRCAAPHDPAADPGRAPGTMPGTAPVNAPPGPAAATGFVEQAHRW